MKEILQSFISHKDLYILSLSFGGLLTAVTNLFIEYTPTELFGIGISLWIIGFLINLIDIHTGIKADAARARAEGKSFSFKSRKGWRAFEKIVVFTIIIAFLYYNEKEIVRLGLWSSLATLLLSIKYAAFVYVILIEIQSIGENQEDRYGVKPPAFKMLDNIIEVVNEGILNKIKDLFSVKKDNDGADK